VDMDVYYQLFLNFSNKKKVKQNNCISGLILWQG